MHIKEFQDEYGDIWRVYRIGTNVKIKGNGTGKRKKYEIARSCALKLGVLKTPAGVDMQDIVHHQRIWNAIWHLGRPLDQG